MAVLVLGGAVLLTLTSSDSVEVTPGARAGSPPCAAVSALWPTEAGGEGRRETAPAQLGIAAYGDPAIIARCGVAALGPTENECLDVDGIDWVVETLSDGRRFTTYGRDPALEILVPRAYAPETLLLPAFGPAAGVLPGNGRACQ